MLMIDMSKVMLDEEDDDDVSSSSSSLPEPPASSSSSDGAAMTTGSTPRIYCGALLRCLPLSSARRKSCSADEIESAPSAAASSADPTIFANVVYVVSLLDGEQQVTASQ